MRRAALAVVLLAACADPVTPLPQGRDGMLSQTSVAKKCEEAKEGHDRPFVVEWDATDLASFEAAAQQRTMFVHYEGCSLKVLYECRDPAVVTRFGAYGSPQFTSGTVQGFDIQNEGELYTKLPLGAATLSGRVAGGEALHLEYFVSGVATSSRESVFTKELAGMPGCETATHFVWAYNLGAFELETSAKSSAEAKVAVGSAGGGGRGQKAHAEVGHGGSIASCSTQDQRACRVPIRLALRPVRPGENPLDRAPAPQAATPAPANAANDAVTEANRLLYEKKDGPGCLKLLDRALALDPRTVDNHVLKNDYPRCLMRAGRCDEGTKRLRELFAADDPKRLKSDAQLDAEVYAQANGECPSSTAKNDGDFVVRASRELLDSAAAKDVKECRAGFERVLARTKGAEAQPGAQHPRSVAPAALTEAAKAIAAGTSCSEGFPYYERAYCYQLRGASECKRVAKDSWETLRKMGQISCK